MAELKPCPFCGGEAKTFRCDRVFTIGCEPCGYHMAFSGWLQTVPNGRCVSSDTSSVKEYYHHDAWDKAIEVWNRRASDG